MGRIELPASPLPRECSTTELHGHLFTTHTPTELLRGAGEGNRTLVLSLEGFSSTIELHPHNHYPQRYSHNRYSHIIWWREKDSNLRRQSRQIYSLIPLTAWVSLQPGTRNSHTTHPPCQPIGTEWLKIIAEIVPSHTISNTRTESRANVGNLAIHELENRHFTRFHT